MVLERYHQTQNVLYVGWKVPFRNLVIYMFPRLPVQAAAWEDVLIWGKYQAPSLRGNRCGGYT